MVIVMNIKWQNQNKTPRETLVHKSYIATQAAQTAGSLEAPLKENSAEAY